MALTPVAVLMFRFNNPDAMLVLLLVGVGVRHAPCGRGLGVGCRRREWPRSPLARPRRHARGPRLPGEDAAVVPGDPGTGRGLRAVRRRHLAPQAPPPAGSRGRDGPRCRLVDRDRVGVAGRVSPLHRRLAAQLDPRAHPRLQRLRPAQRLGDRLGRRRQHHRWPVGRDRAFPDVRLRGRHPGRLADPGRPDPRCGGPVVRPRPGRAGRALGPDPLARLAARHRPHLQLHGRDLPRLLHRGPGARDRRPRRDRLPGAVAAPRLAGRHRAAGTHHAPSPPRCRSSSSPATRRGTRGCGGPCSSSASPVPP